MKKIKTILASALLFAGAFSYAQSENIVGVAAGNENFSTLVTAVQTAGLVETLSSEGPFTGFGVIIDDNSNHQSEFVVDGSTNFNFGVDEIQKKVNLAFLGNFEGNLKNVYLGALVNLTSLSETVGKLASLEEKDIFIIPAGNHNNQDSLRFG